MKERERIKETDKQILDSRQTDKQITRITQTNRETGERTRVSVPLDI